MNHFSFAKYKAGVSLLLIFLFSLMNFFWKSNAVVETFNKTTSVLDYFTLSLDKAGDSFFNIFEIYTRHKSHQEEISLLEKRLFDYEKLYVEYHYLLEENQQLRNLLTFPKIPKYEVIKAKVISFDSHLWSQQLLVNQGSENGIAPFMPVVALYRDEKSVTNNLKQTQQYIVVGKTMYVSKNFTRILPVTSSFFKTGVRIKNRGNWSMFAGFDIELNGPVLEFLNLNSITLSGEEVVTSGGKGIYPPNLLIGVIGNKQARSQGFQKVNVDVIVNLDTLDYVAILKKKTQTENTQKEINTLLKKKDLVFYKEYLER